MTREIEFSVVSHGPETEAYLKSALREFELLHHIRVRLHTLDREQAWAELVRYALYGHGPDVSEIGLTWLSTLVSMNALSVITPDMTARLRGGSSSFHTASWKSGLSGDEGELWAIPWLADTRVLYYRRDLLSQAGIDETTAFQTHESLKQTLETLHTHGLSPWIVPTERTTLTLHNIANWIWNAGGDFVSSDGARVMFDQPEARAGMRAYFELGRYLPEHLRGLTDNRSDEQFALGQAAVTISGPWVRCGIERWGDVAPEIRAHLGAALVPARSIYLGGSSFVIWRHSQRQQEVMELIRFLCNQDMQAEFSPIVGLLPVHPDALKIHPFADDSVYQTLGQAIQIGRSFPTYPLWGLIEDKLIAALADIWKEIFDTPNPNLDSVIAHHIEPLANRLNLTLTQRRLIKS